MARPRKTAAYKSLVGTLRADRLKAEDFEDAEPPGNAVSGRPKMPGHLSPEAIEAWKGACKLLKAKGTLAKTDAATLEIYSEVKATWIAAKKDVLERGQLVEEKRFTKSGDPYTVTIINPSVAIQRDAERQLLAFTKSLGLAPDSREKVRRTRPTTKKQSEQAAIETLWPFLVKKQEVENEEENDDAGRT
jgi:P27 family predicted phage terminase small subunit